MFHLSLRLLYDLAALEEDAVGADLGVSSGLDSGDFWRLGPYLVAFDVADMIRILISLALFKLKSKLWSVDLLWTMFMLFILGCIYFLLLVWWPVHLVTIYDIYDVVLFLWYYYVMFHLLSLNLIVFSKVFHCSFLVTMREVFFSQRSCLGRT